MGVFVRIKDVQTADGRMKRVLSRAIAVVDRVLRVKVSDSPAVPQKSDAPFSLATSAPFPVLKMEHGKNHAVASMEQCMRTSKTAIPTKDPGRPRFPERDRGSVCERSTVFHCVP